MYLETIYILEKANGHAHGVDIAKRLGISQPGVSKAMKYLKAEGFVNTEKYGSITLTEKGRELSEEIFKKHQLIENFLRHSLKLSGEQASTDACKIEHVLSGDMVEAIKTYLKENNVEIQ